VSSQKKSKEKRSRKQGKKQRKRTEEEIRGDQRVSKKNQQTETQEQRGRDLKEEKEENILRPTLGSIPSSSSSSSPGKTILLCFKCKCCKTVRR